MLSEGRKADWHILYRPIHNLLNYSSEPHQITSKIIFFQFLTLAELNIFENLVTLIMRRMWLGWETVVVGASSPCWATLTEFNNANWSNDTEGWASFLKKDRFSQERTELLRTIPSFRNKRTKRKEHFLKNIGTKRNGY